MGVQAPQYGLHPDSGGWLCWEYEKRWYPQVPELPGLLRTVAPYLRLLAEAEER